MKQGWMYKKLGDICDVIGGGTPSKSVSRYYSGDIPWATVRDMKNEILINTEFRITKEAVKNSSTNIIPRKNVVIASRVGLGKVCLLENDIAINQDLRAIIPKDSNVLYVKYLFHWLKSIANIIVEEGTGATVQGVKLPFIKSLLIPIPAISEQKRIVGDIEKAFAAIDKAKANTEKNLLSVRELFESYLEGVFEDQSWDMKELSEITEVKDGTHDSPKYIKEGIPFVTQKNIKSNGLSFVDTRFITKTDHDKFYRRSDVTFGDILISMIGANRGMAAIVDDKRVFSIKNVGLIKSNKNINMSFLLYYLKSKQAMNYVLDMSNGGAQEFIGLTALRRFPIPYPPLKVQIEIVKKLDSLYFESKKLELIYTEKSDSLGELKKSILQKAFSGELN